MNFNFRSLVIVTSLFTLLACNTILHKAIVPEKYTTNPVLGGKLGTVYDPCILPDEDSDKYKMYFSWYDNGLGIGYTESMDGLSWSKPVICFEFNFIKGSKNWDRFGNRPVVLKKDGIYHMWYSGQNAQRSCIGYATSGDGKVWKKQSDLPVLEPSVAWEQNAIYCNQVIWDEEQKIFKMWYSAGDRVEPDAIGYATSPDGKIWEKHESNPVFSPDPNTNWEKLKVNSCQVIKRSQDYLMVYTGYANPEHPQIALARSKDGITHWERYPSNPLLKPTKGWDEDGLYTPYLVQDKKNDRWLLYYTGRRKWIEQIGLATVKENEFSF